VRWISLAALALLVSLVGLFALAPASAQTSDSAATHTSPRVEVLVQDLHQGPAELAEGSLFRLQLTGQGLRAQAGLSGGHYLSPALSSSFPFTHVGIHWRSNRPEGSSVAFSVQTSKDGVSWGPWHPVRIEAFPGEAADDETYGALIRADRANRVRFSADFPADEGNLTVEYVVLTLLNVYDGPPLPGPTLSAAEMAVEGDEGKPINFAREDWGADESLRFSDDGEIWPRAYVSTKKVVVHHTVTGNNYKTVEDAKADVRAIYTYHASTLGWGDIGYNSLVDKFGNSYEGRYGRDGPDYDGPGGREILSEDVVAGHALAHNYGSTGVALLGTFCSKRECPRGTTPSEAMISRLKEILVWESRQHGIDPHGASDFLLSTDAWNRGLDNICGHRDCTNTICPGETVYELLPSLRDHVAAQLSDANAPTVTITAHPPEDTVDDGDASYTWGDAAGSGDLVYSYYLEGWFKPSNSDDINYLSGYNENKEPQWSDWTVETAKSFSGLEDGHYTFHVRAKDSDDNISVYEDNRTFLANLSAALTHDVAVTAVSAPSSVTQGDTVNVGVTVENQGVNEETFDVTLSDTTGDVIIGVQSVTLAVGEAKTVTFSWNTIDATLGDHILTASHDFADDDPSNDSKSTTVTVKEPTAGVTVTSIDPNTMEAGMTEYVTVCGTGFQAGAEITFKNGIGPAPTASGEVLASELPTVCDSAADSSAITATVTAKSGGPPRQRVWDVRVTNPDGSSGVLVEGFTVNPY